MRTRQARINSWSARNCLHKRSGLVYDQPALAHSRTKDSPAKVFEAYSLAISFFSQRADDFQITTSYSSNASGNYRKTIELHRLLLHFLHHMLLQIRFVI